MNHINIELRKTCLHVPICKLTTGKETGFVGRVVECLESECSDKSDRLMEKMERLPSRSRTHQAADSTVTKAAGELVTCAGGFGVSISGPLLLATTLLSCVALRSSDELDSLFTSPANSSFGFLPAAYVPALHAYPVKLLTLKPLRCHFRVGLPVRSRARRHALMAPWLALGPSLGAAGTAMLVSTSPFSPL